MPTAFDAAFKRVKELVADFKAKESFFLSSQYSEAAARKDYIDEFFIALGWDVNHKMQRNPYEQEVKIERNESGSSRKADYAFFLAPNFRKVQFFVEAKRPENNFSPDDYFQTIRYGWGNTPISALTNFRQFHVLDCRFEPHILDCQNRVFKRFELDDYTNEDKFAEIYWLFSREAIADNSIAKRAAEMPRPTSTIFRRELYKTADQPPDESFLIELDGYRERLAKAFKEKNPKLTGEQLTEIVQRVIDRLVFIRFLEDKQIEPEFHLQRFVSGGGSTWEKFLSTSANLNRKYNGAVFKPHEIDSPGFQIDETPFRNICEELADETTKYNFAYIPIHILGSIYERFLGKIITDGARVVDKPEVRKAGGVYYTPEYIVRYIVENTVGKAIEGKTPEEISQMTFADIACGSGSFLIEVFETLLRYHAKFYSANLNKAKKGDCVKRNDGLHLSLKKKQEILRNNIFGVDIDRQAVEVAQLSLYLKLLEDETIGSAAEFQNEFHYTLLPPLTENVICGNSLIDWDIADGGKLSEEEVKKLNPMDFAQRFPKIFKRKTSGGELREAAPGEIGHDVPGGMPLHGSYGKVSYRKAKKEKTILSPEFDGGFDGIVGNPPYISIQSGFVEPRVYDYLLKHYRTLQRIADFFGLMSERVILLLKQGGYYGYIIPSTVQGNKSFTKLRQLFLTQTRIVSIVHFADGVFEQAVVPTNVIVAQKIGLNSSTENKVEVVTDIVDFEKKQFTQKFIEQKNFNQPPDYLFNLGHDLEQQALLEKIRNGKTPLSEFLNIKEGIKTGNDKQFLTQKASGKNIFPVLKGRDIDKYSLQSNLFIKYDEEKLSRPQSREHFLIKEKLLVRRVGDHLVATYDNKQHFCVHTLYTARPKTAELPSLKFLLGLINSKLLQFFYRQTTPQKGNVFPEVRIYSLNELPVCKAGKSSHDKLVSLVEKMMEARRQSSAALMDSDKDFYKNQCDALDRQIDALVYELYGLTPEEIQIVEGENKIPVGQPLSGGVK
jgi:type I restriction-modification system DNA methylase subunit